MTHIDLGEKKVRIAQAKDSGRVWGKVYTGEVFMVVEFVASGNRYDGDVDYAPKVHQHHFNKWKKR